MGWVNKGPGQYILSKLLWNQNANINLKKDPFRDNLLKTAQPPQAKAVQLKINAFRRGETVAEDEMPLISYEQSKKNKCWRNSALVKKEKINRDETFFVDVKPGENSLWVINMQAGVFSLEGVPPYIGDSPLTMLLPSYVKK